MPTPLSAEPCAAECAVLGCALPDCDGGCLLDAEEDTCPICDGDHTEEEHDSLAALDEDADRAEEV